MESEMAEELRRHVEELARANIAAGMEPGEAHFAAQRSFGGLAQIEEECRDERTFVWMDQLGSDFRLAARSLRRARGFTFTILLIIALCLAANVAIFSIVDSALLRPLPFHDSGQLVAVYDAYPGAGVNRAGVSAPHYLESKKGIAAFANAATMASSPVTINAGSASERVEAAYVTPSFFPLLGVNAAVGRTFVDEEGYLGRDHVVLLTDGFWREHFNSLGEAIGRTLLIFNEPFTIVGILPPDFHFLSHGAKLWMPLSFSEFYMKLRYGGGFEMIARLRPGATISQGQAEINALNERSLKTDPEGKVMTSVGFHTVVRDLHADHVADLRLVLLFLQAGALFLLTIGAVNAANLTMVRVSGRTKEYSLRQALGASHLRVVRMIVVETLLLSIVGGLLGIGLGAALFRSVTSLAGDRLATDVAPHIDAVVCLVAIGASVLLGLFLALPAVFLSLHRNLSVALTIESRGGTTTRSVHRLRHALIVAQIALTFVLLSGAGLLGLSFARVLAVKPGFLPDKLMTGTVSLVYSDYPGPKQRVEFIERLAVALRALPGVTSAAISTGVPFSGRIQAYGWAIEGNKDSANMVVGQALFSYWISGDYFTTFGIPLLEGRAITDDDAQQQRRICVVDEEFSSRYWPKGDAIGHRLVFSAPSAKGEYLTIVGVVGSVKQDDLADQRAHGAIYVPIQVSWNSFDYMMTLRTEQTPSTLGSEMRTAAAGLAPDLPLYDVKPMTERLDESVAGRRIPFFFGGGFAGLSLMLAAVGIYSVIAFSVAQRKREIGVRMALGAQPDQISWQFVGLCGRLLGIGLPIGLVGAWFTGRAMFALLYDVAPMSPLVIASAAFVLTAFAMLACLIPSFRAARVSPTEALRCE